MCIGSIDGMRSCWRYKMRAAEQGIRMLTYNTKHNVMVQGPTATARSGGLGDITSDTRHMLLYYHANGLMAFYFYTQETNAILLS